MIGGEGGPGRFPRDLELVGKAPAGLLVPDDCAEIFLETEFIKLVGDGAMSNGTASFYSLRKIRGFFLPVAKGVNADANAGADLLFIEAEAGEPFNFLKVKFNAFTSCHNLDKDTLVNRK
jgi:hypothetical protein